MTLEKSYAVRLVAAGSVRMRALRHEVYLLEGEADQSEQHARALRDRALTLRSELYALEMVKEATHD